MTSETKRIQIEVTPEKLGDVKSLMEETDIRTYIDFFNNAATLLSWAVQQIKDGRVVASLDEQSGQYKELVLPAFMAVKEKRPVVEQSTENFAAIADMIFASDANFEAFAETVASKTRPFSSSAAIPAPALESCLSVVGMSTPRAFIASFNEKKREYQIVSSNE